MDKWQWVWRHGISKVLTRRELDALKEALLRDDHRLIQMATAKPVFYDEETEEVQGACPIAICGLLAGNRRTVSEVLAYFDEVRIRTDEKLGEGACEIFINWVDSSPRAEVISGLLYELNLEAQWNSASFPVRLPTAWNG